MLAFKYIFLYLPKHFSFYFTLEIEGVFPFLVASYLHKNSKGINYIMYVWIMT